MACPGLRRPSSQARYPVRTGAALGSAKTDRMRCSHGNLDAVGASGTPNPRKVTTSNTSAVCAVNEPADQWRQSAWQTYGCHDQRLSRSATGVPGPTIRSPNPALVCGWRDSRENCTDQPVLEAVGLIEDAVRRRAAGDLGQ